MFRLCLILTFWCGLAGLAFADCFEGMPAIEVYPEYTSYCECECSSVVAANYLTVKHTEGSGLGYSTGYSSLGVFLSQPLCHPAFLSFLDMRGHLFNNGKYAANLGGGIRYLNQCGPCGPRIWGLSAFYDYLKRHHKTYHQVTISGESLGEQWDLLVNGYIPVGRTKSNIYQFSYQFIEQRPNGGFEPTFLLKARERLAFKGVDCLFRYHFCITPCYTLDLSLGPYIYWGRTVKTVNAFRRNLKHAYGGQARACLYLARYLYVEGIGSYDTRFKWNGQGVIALNIPLDCLFRAAAYCQEGCQSSCCLLEKLYRRVQRNEIIVEDSVKRLSRNPNVLDPENPPL